MRNLEKEQYWRGVLAQRQQSGLSTAAFCRQAGITVSMYYSWKKAIESRDAENRLAEEAMGSVPTFVPVKISQAEDVHSPVQQKSEVGHVEIWLRNGHVVRAGGMSTGDLAELVRKLESAKC